jgi:arylsulfatase A-like enzyme
VLAERACEFVAEAEAYDDRPFLLVVTPLAPHIEVFNPLDVCSIRSAPRHADMFLTETLSDKPSRNEPDMSDKPWWTWDGRTFDLSPDQCMNRHYRSRLRSMLAVDDLIGVIGRSLEETGELENTVIVFTSDNGFLMAEHRIFGKFHAYEEAIRVPLAIRTPGRAARSESAIALNIDLAPTIADLAGITPYTEAASQRYCDGRSLRPLLEGRTPTQWRRRFLVENVSDNGDESEMIAHAAVRMGASENRFARHSLYTHYFQADPQAEEYYDNLDSVPDKYQEKSTHSALPALWRTALRWLAAKLRGCSNRPDQPFSCRQLEDL